MTKNSNQGGGGPALIPDIRNIQGMGPGVDDQKCSSDACQCRRSRQQWGRSTEEMTKTGTSVGVAGEWQMNCAVRVLGPWGRVDKWPFWQHRRRETVGNTAFASRHCPNPACSPETKTSPKTGPRRGTIPAKRFSKTHPPWRSPSSNHVMPTLTTSTQGRPVTAHTSLHVPTIPMPRRHDVPKSPGSRVLAPKGPWTNLNPKKKTQLQVRRPDNQTQHMFMSKIRTHWMNDWRTKIMDQAKMATGRVPVWRQMSCWLVDQTTFSLGTWLSSWHRFVLEAPRRLLRLSNVNATTTSTTE